MLRQLRQARRQLSMMKELDIKNIVMENQGFVVKIDEVLNTAEKVYHDRINHGTGVEDKWTSDSQMGTWSIIHHQPRMTLFTPSKSWRGPQAIWILAGRRITEGRFINGDDFTLIDDWKDQVQSHRCLKQPWIGRTTFVELPCSTQ